MSACGPRAGLDGDPFEARGHSKDLMIPLTRIWLRNRSPRNAGGEKKEMAEICEKGGCCFRIRKRGGV